MMTWKKLSGMMKKSKNQNSQNENIARELHRQAIELYNKFSEVVPKIRQIGIFGGVQLSKGSV